MRAVVVITNNETGIDKYYYEEEDFMPVELADNEYIKKYACLSEAIKDSYCWQSDHYSDGECLDYVMGVIKQLERR